jgi:probable HAF family extracellular repeat protein
MKATISLLPRTLILLCALAVPVGLAAEDAHKPTHHHYKLIELGTFGGPNSYFTFITPGRSLNNHGAATGSADTSVALSSPFCLFDCFATHAFQWKEGIMTDLGALPEFGASFPNYINDTGVVAGSSFNGGSDPVLALPYFDAVIFKDGQVVDLGTFGGPLSYSAAINNKDQVVGFALNSTPDSFDLGDSCENFPMPTQMHAFIWQEGVLTDLGTLGGTDSCALFVNDRSQIGGVSFTNSTVNPSTGLPTIHPFLWDDGKMVDLGSLGGTLAFVGGINNRGQVAGNSSLAGDQTFHAFIWEKGKLTDLGSLGGIFIEVIGFNEAGELVGKAQLPDQTFHAYLANSGGIMDLGTQDGDPCSYALDINLKEQIVGNSDDCFGNNSRGFLWENDKMTDLNALVHSGSAVTLTVGISINDRGEITAQGVLANGDQRAVVLIPCDEGHPDVEGCDYGPVDAARAAQRPVDASGAHQVPSIFGRRLRAQRFPLGSAHPLRQTTP